MWQTDKTCIAMMLARYNACETVIPASTQRLGRRSQTIITHGFSGSSLCVLTDALLKTSIRADNDKQRVAQKMPDLVSHG